MRQSKHHAYNSSVKIPLVVCHFNSGTKNTSCHFLWYRFRNHPTEHQSIYHFHRAYYWKMSKRDTSEIAVRFYRNRTMQHHKSSTKTLPFRKKYNVCSADNIGPTNAKRLNDLVTTGTWWLSLINPNLFSFSSLYQQIIYKRRVFIRAILWFHLSVKKTMIIILAWLTLLKMSYRWRKRSHL